MRNPINIIRDFHQRNAPIVVQMSRQYKTPFTKFHVVWPLYDFMPDSIAVCSSSSNFRNLVRAIDFQSSSLQMFFLFERHLNGSQHVYGREKCRRQHINNAKTNDRKFSTSGTRAICSVACAMEMCLPIICHAKVFPAEIMLGKHEEKAYFYAKLNID